MCGFLCARANYNVVIIDSFVHGNYFNPSWATIIRGDYADTALLKTIFSSYTISAVVHCAASIEVGISVKDPISFDENNVLKTITLIDQMLRGNIKNIIFFQAAPFMASRNFCRLPNRML